VNDAIVAIRTVLNAVELHYRNAATGYEDVSHLGDAEALLRVLRDGIEARKELMERCSSREGTCRTT